jgi:hypothetical protein
MEQRDDTVSMIRYQDSQSSNANALVDWWHA